MKTRKRLSYIVHVIDVEDLPIKWDRKISHCGTDLVITAIPGFSTGRVRGMVAWYKLQDIGNVLSGSVHRMHIPANLLESNGIINVHHSYNFCLPLPQAWQQSTRRCVWEIDSTRYRSAQIAIYSCHGYVYASLYRTLLLDIKTRHNRSLDSPWGRKMVIYLGRWMPDRRRAFIFVLMHDISINIELWERKLLDMNKVGYKQMTGEWYREVIFLSIISKLRDPQLCDLCSYSGTQSCVNDGWDGFHRLHRALQSVHVNQFVHETFTNTHFGESLGSCHGHLTVSTPGCSKFDCETAQYIW